MFHGSMNSKHGDVSFTADGQRELDVAGTAVDIVDVMCEIQDLTLRGSVSDHVAAVGCAAPGIRALKGKGTMTNRAITSQ